MQRDYKACKDNEARAKFRSERLQQKIEDIIDTYSEEKILRKEDIKRSQMLTYPQIVVAEGGWSCAPAIATARRYVLKCLLLGQEFYEYDSMRGTTTYCYMTKERKDIFSSAWSRRIELDHER